MEPLTLDAFTEPVPEYTVDGAAEISGVEPGLLPELAELYADPERIWRLPNGMYRTGSARMQ